MMQVALPQAEIYQRLTGLGWQVPKIDLKNGIYIAKGEGPAGEQVERVGQTPEGALAALLMFAVRSTQIRQFVSRRQVLGGWSRGWEDQLKEIGSAYSKLRVFDQKAVPAWKALATESGKQADAIRAQIKVEETDSPEPYDSLREMVQDVHHDKRFLVSRAHANHPVWSKVDVVNFRIVHEVLGHIQSGGDFSWVGENMAIAVHMPLVTPLAREALFVEVLAQSAYQNLYHGYGPQKIGFMSEFLHPVQGDEGEHVAVPHGGIPDLGGMAAVMNSEDAYGWTKTPQGDWKQVADKNKQSEPKTSADVAPHIIGVDPNKDWQTPPEFVSPAVAAGQEGDYIDQLGTFDNAAKIDTDWSEKDPDTQRQAIMNALRVAILSPQKNLRWNSAHFQAIKDMPHDATAPDMWQRLEEERNSHNDKLGVPPLAHAQVSTQVAFLADELEKQNPSLTRAEARRQAKQTFYDTIKSFEEQLFMDADEADELTPMRRHIEARKLAVEYLRERYTPAKGWQPGQTTLEAKTADTLFNPGQTEVTNDATGFAAPDAKYGAFQAAHLEGIEDASKHVDEIRSAALKDIHETGGTGHLFRHALLNLNIKGISAKVASFAWLLLRPLTSDLGIIDTHMARGLGVQAAGNSVPLRDYYKAERMQRAAKDASGYGHLPLGIYHWGLWDTVRSGPGTHSDHSTLRVLDPEPHNEQFWPAASNAKQEFVGPPEFERVRPAMSAVGHQFDKELGHLPQGEIPEIRKAILEQPQDPNPNMHMMSKTATDDWAAFKEEPGEFADVNWNNMDWDLPDEKREQYWNNRQPWIYHDGTVYLGNEGEYHGDLTSRFADLRGEYARDLPVGHKVGDEVYGLNDAGKQVEKEVRRRIANGEYKQEPEPEDFEVEDEDDYDDFPEPEHE